jgi:hypothetical protein
VGIEALDLINDADYNDLFSTLIRIIQVMAKAHDLVPKTCTW